MYKNPLLVSIGLPTYNGEKYITQALKSLLSQSYKNIEINISDNHSTDKTPEICKTYAHKYPHIKYFRQKKMITPVDNFNFVLSKAKGEYFMWAADDDYWSPNLIEVIMNEYLKINDDKIGLIFPKIITVNQDGKAIGLRSNLFENRINKYITLEEFMKESYYSDKANIIYGLFRKKYLTQIGGFYDKSTFTAVDIFTLQKFLSIAKVRGINKTAFYKRVYCTQAQSVMKIIQRIMEVTPNLIENSMPANLFWHLRQIFTYFILNQDLIKKYHEGDLFYFTYLNIISSFKLFLINFPLNINYLKRAEKYTSR